MPAKIFLNVTEGPMKETRYRFDEHMLCIIGRADNCTLQLMGEAGEGVSRHHCLLDIQPPFATLRDLASRNGTFLNGKNIGKESEEQDNETIKSYQLANGDIFKIGNNTFKIELIPALKCGICHRLLPDGYEAPDDIGVPVCHQCHDGGINTPVSAASETLRIKNCRVCGIEFTSFRSARDDHLCPECRRRRDTNQMATWKMAEEAQQPSNLLVIPGYKVLRQIGRGGMGVVYLGQSRETLEKVALKILLPDIAVHDSCREDFMREAKNLKPLKHPNIIELKDCNYSNGALYLVMEYCSAGTLREYLNRRNCVLEVPTALNLLYQILDALDYAHNVRTLQSTFYDLEEQEAHGLVHRDIKPENIFISENYDGSITAKIADFGISKAYDLAGMSGCTRTGDFSGTLGFIPKQQFLNFKYVKPEVDVWAAAATFFYMLTGKPPRNFAQGEITDIFEHIPDPIRAINGNVPIPVAQVLAIALNDREQLRYKTAMSLKFAMQDAERKSY